MITYGARFSMYVRFRGQGSVTICLVIGHDNINAVI